MTDPSDTGPGTPAQAASEAGLPELELEEIGLDEPRPGEPGVPPAEAGVNVSAPADGTVAPIDAAQALAELTQALAEPARKHLDPNGPLPMRMMAAKGLAPLPPKDMVVVLCGLCLNSDEKVASAAAATLQGLPDKILGPALDGKLPGVALRLIVPGLANRDLLVEKLALARETPDDVVAVLASTATERVAEIISNNQERCMRSSAIVGALRANPSILRSSLDRLFDFLARSGIIYDGMPEFAEAIARLSPHERESMAEQIVLPTDVQHLLAEGPDAEERAKVLAETLEKLPEGKADHVPMLKLIGQLNVAQKISLAIKGNREARTLLIRDSNKVVATAAVRSPRLTEQEIVAAAQSRSVADEVIRIIASSRDMTRAYSVKLALVGNPKTPMQTSMHLLTLLRANDVRHVAKSKNVPSAVANHAKRLASQKSGGG